MAAVQESESAAVIGPRTVGQTGVAIFPLAVDGGIFGWAAGQADTVSVLDVFSAAGGNLISTADHYAGGRSEIMIGHWLDLGRNRDRMLIATKVGRHPDAPGLRAANVRRAVDASLMRLRVDHIDFLSLDGEDPATPIEETLDAVQAIIAAGKVRHLAAAAFSSRRVAEFAEIAEKKALPPIQALITEYNLMDRLAYEKEIAPHAVALGRGALAKLPLASGYLTGQFRTRDDVPDSVMFGGAVRHIGKRGNKVLSALEAVSAETGATLGCVALAWVLLKPGIAGAIVRAKDSGQIGELLAAPRVQLTRHQVAVLDEASA